MARGFKSGGRQAGTLNKRTQTLMERPEELGCDPVEALTRIAQDETASLELRARRYSDLMQYLYPRRRGQSVPEACRHSFTFSFPAPRGHRCLIVRGQRVSCGLWSIQDAPCVAEDTLPVRRCRSACQRTSSSA